MPVTRSRVLSASTAVRRFFGRPVSILRRLAVERRGTVTILFGLAAIPIIVAAGIALDTARAYTLKMRLGAALDAAALAVGSEATTATAAQLTTALNNYFYDNYCKTVPSGTSVSSCQKTVANEYNISVQATSTITSATVNYTAQATVPTTFMRLVGINQLTVTVKAQTTKFPGMEIAVVLDNTGSMLCGANEGISTVCGADVVTSDTNCTNSNNYSRICTLRNAALQFIQTLQNAITAPQSIYMSIVPYVTTVNIGPDFCTSSTSCSNITTDATSGAFTDLRGYIMPVVQISGNTTSGSTSVTSVSMVTPSGTVSGTAALQAGMFIYGHGIPTGATISSVSSTSITLSSSATLTFTGNILAAGPLPNAVCSTCTVLGTPYTDPTTYNAKANWTSGSSTMTLNTGYTTTNNVVAGMVVTGTGIPSGTIVSTVVSATQVTLSKATTQTGSSTSVVFSLAGNTTLGSTTISNLKGTNASLNSIVVGMAIGGSSGIPANAYVTSTTGSPPTSLTISAPATSTNTGDILTLTNLGATTQTGSTIVTGVSFPSVPTVGNVIVGNGIPVNTTITAVSGTASQFSVGAGQITMSNRATTPTNFSSATGTCCNTALAQFAPLTYDSTYNTASPSGSSTTQNWGGCVIEPTSSSENASGTGVLAVSGNPDVSEPVSGTKWYPFYWVRDSANAWATSTSTSIAKQDTTTEIQGGEQTDWLAQDGPNQGCPVPILPLTDLTTSAGQTTLQNTINSMWARDAGGTQVHIGMIWGWRTLSPNGPFTANNGHPLSYAQATSTGWKKIVVLMTDGNEEWPATDNLTGLGQIADGKIGTTSTTTAVTNLGTRLSSVCSNMANDGIIIFAIGLGSNAQANTALYNCPANGGFYESATPSNIANVFQDIAKSIIHLRLTM